MNGNMLYEMSQYMQNLSADDLAFLPKEIIIALKVIGKLAPLFYQADTRSEEEFLAVIEPAMREQLMDLSGGKGRPRLYLPASARISKFRDIWRNGFIFSCIIEHNPDKKVMKKTLRAKKTPSEPDVYDEVACYGEAEALAIIFTGREQVGMGHKIEDAAGFEDYRIKAITGAKGRAAADLGLGTADVLKEDDAAIADAPIDPKMALLMGASNGSSAQGTKPAPVAPRPRDEAPIQGSVAVTTRATVEKPANEKIDVNAIRNEIVALRTKLTQPEKFQITQYLAYLGIPINQSEWLTPQYTQVLQAMKEWLFPVEAARPTKEQVDSINGYANTINRMHLQQTCVRLCGVDGSNKLNTTRMAYLLGVLAKGAMIYELTNQVDPEFTLIQTFGCASPFDLLFADRGPEQKNWYDYRIELRLLAEKKSPSAPFLKKYEKEYAAFLQG